MAAPARPELVRLRRKRKSDAPEFLDLEILPSQRRRLEQVTTFLGGMAVDGPGAPAVGSRPNEPAAESAAEPAAAAAGTPGPRGPLAAVAGGTHGSRPLNNAPPAGGEAGSGSSPSTALAVDGVRSAPTVARAGPSSSAVSAAPPRPPLEGSFAPGTAAAAAPTLPALAAGGGAAALVRQRFRRVGTVSLARALDPMYCRTLLAHLGGKAGAAAFGAQGIDPALAEYNRSHAGAAAALGAAAAAAGGHAAPARPGAAAAGGLPARSPAAAARHRDIARAHAAARYQQIARHRGLRAPAPKVDEPGGPSAAPVAGVTDAAGAASAAASSAEEDTLQTFFCLYDLEQIPAEAPPHAPGAAQPPRRGDVRRQQPGTAARHTHLAPGTFLMNGRPMAVEPTPMDAAAEGEEGEEEADFSGGEEEDDEDVMDIYAPMNDDDEDISDGDDLPMGGGDGTSGRAGASGRAGPRGAAHAGRGASVGEPGSEGALRFVPLVRVEQPDDLNELTDEEGTASDSDGDSNREGAPGQDYPSEEDDDDDDDDDGSGREGARGGHGGVSARGVRGRGSRPSLPRGFGAGENDEDWSDNDTAVIDPYAAGPNKVDASAFAYDPDAPSSDDERGDGEGSDGGAAGEGYDSAGEEARERAEYLAFRKQLSTAT